jgi:hypothetical protein
VIGDLDELLNGTSPQPEWVNMGSWAFDTDLIWSEGKYRATFWIPPFLPEDITISFIAMIRFEDTEEMRAALLRDQVPLPPNEPPEVSITTPVDGEQFGGTVSLEGTATDDESVESVEYRVDGGAWTEVEGTDSWSLELNTTSLSSSTHRLEVRSFDGEEYSTMVDAVFEVDQAPDVVIAAPTEGEVVNGTVSIFGTASDDNSVEGVEWRTPPRARRNGPSKWPPITSHSGLIPWRPGPRTGSATARR